ncbi:MAG: DUF4876 domain-containing protein [Bacteroidales bacterium]|nr:DUF4876 domain-containing protein [Bacteroidales bacterium]
MRSFLTTSLAFISAIGLSSCLSSDDQTQPITIYVNVENPSGLSGLTGWQTVSLISSTGYNYMAQTDADGTATFTNVIPDIYNVSASWSITSDQYMDATGETVQHGTYVLSGALANQVLIDDATRLTLSTNCARKQSVLISKVYYAGCKDNNNKNYLAGRFVELYNNSDEAVDVAGMYLCLMESGSTPAYIISTQTDYIYIKQVFQFPDEGHHILQPGEHILVTNSAVDHTENAAADYDESNADFECKSNVNNAPANNPATPAMKLIWTAFATIPNMNLVQGGPCGIALIETEEDPAQWEPVYADGKSSGIQQLKAPAKYVVDGVDILKYRSDGTVDVSTKRFYDYIDAGYTNINAVNGYNGEVVYRVVESWTDDGRALLKDTNYSLDDWACSTGINIGEYK